MSARMRAVYRQGAFFPEEPCDLPENAEVDLLVEPTRTEPPRVTDPEERARLLRELTDSIRRNPIPVAAPRWTRDELHERD